jgi:hypothetical protein
VHSAFLRGVDDPIAITPQRLDVHLHSAHCFTHRSVFPRSEIIARFAVARSIDELLQRESKTAAMQDLAELRTLLEDQLDNSRLGLTGSMRLGASEDGSFHDLDVMITSELEDNAKVITRLNEIAESNPDRRVHEFGKSWRIRLLTDNGLLCCFFGYSNPADAPLHTMKSMHPLRDIESKVESQTTPHNSYMPTIVTVNQPIGMLSRARCKINCP